ncbi:MAG: sulfide/dihydroorotate dehydrogenase-like FAD/NAD-binding protein [Promethearchaeota archaeon]
MSKSELKITIDGKEIFFKEGQTILEAAKAAGIYIPTLCYIEGLTPYGGCRLCLCKVENMRGYPPACTTPATDGMKVITKDDELQNLRRDVLKLILSEHPYTCLVCDNKMECEIQRTTQKKMGRMFGCFSCSNKDKCELRDVVDYIGINTIEYELDYKNLPLKRGDPFIDVDPNMCILCGKCVRICNELKEIGAIYFINRGAETQISTPFNSLYINSDCQFCGACVDICPTGAITSKNTKWYNKSSTMINSTCGFCATGCDFNYYNYEDKLVESIPVQKIENIKKVCLFGRFCSVAFNNNKDRLNFPLIRKESNLIPREWEEAYFAIKESLEKYTSDQIAVIISPDLTIETAYVLIKFCKEVLKTENITISNHLYNVEYQHRKANYEGIERILLNIINTTPEKVKEKLNSGSIKALYLTERIDDFSLLKSIEYIILQDIYPSEIFEIANIVLPSTSFIETTGSIINSDNNLKRFNKIVNAPGKAKEDWKIISELALKFNSVLFNYSNTDEILKEIKEKLPEILTEVNHPSDLFQSAFDIQQQQYLKDPAKINLIKYRGEKISNRVADLKQIIEYISIDRSKEKEIVPDKTEEDDFLKEEPKKFEVLVNIEAAFTMHKMVISAPMIAKKAKPGNFIIIMMEETSERIPLTISDWNVNEGTITFFYQETGYSTRELTELKRGDHLFSAVGPLGNDILIEKFGTVLLGGGCYGNGAIYPIARALKEAGNRIIIILESKNKDFFFYKKEIEAVADEVIYFTSDGSMGSRGKIKEGITQTLDREEKIDLCFFVGCNHMMRDASEATKEQGNIPTFVSLSTIMIDGTGMCGCCRLTLLEDDKEITKFACVDGPFFDGHKVKWDELMQRGYQFTYLETSVFQDHSCKAIEKYNAGEYDE